MQARDSFSPTENIQISAEIIDSGNTFKYHITIPEGFWLGIGFGTNMTDAPILLINDGEGGDAPIIDDTFSKGHGKPDSNPKNEYKYSTTPINKNGVWILEIERLVVIKREGRDETILFDQSIQMIYAFKQGKLSQHAATDRGRLRMLIDSKSGMVVFNRVAVASDMFYKIHGIVMYLSWSILTFFSFVSGRYMKHFYTFRMILHASSGTLIVTNTIIVAILSLKTYTPGSEPKYAHKPIGITVLVMSIVQFLGGLTVRQSHNVLKWQSKYAFFSKYAHLFFGLLLIIISNVQVATGLRNLGSPMKNVIFVHFAIYVLL